ncbi:MAG: PAS domain S-box protein [Sedimentisphaerales bacterium]|nr:PAS domain S-box protein [Sedimentisphaerales bacterium]
MAITGKSKEELIVEINTLRSRIKKLEHSKAELGKAENSLRESEFQYRTILDSMRDAIHVVDTDLTIILMNKKFMEWTKELGVETDEPIGRNVFEVFPFLSDDVRDDYRHVIDTGKVRIAIETNQVAGREIYTESRKIPVCEAGEVTKVITIVRDITKRRRAEEEFIRTKGLLQAAIEQTPAGIVIADAPNVNIRVANSAALGIRGETKEQLMEIPVELHAEKWQLYHPDGTPYEPEDLPLSRAILKGQITTNEEVVIRRQDGEDRLVLANAAPVRDDRGKVIAGIAVFPDITERKRLEEAYQSLVDHSVQGLTIIQDGRMVFLNKAFSSSTGFTKEEMLAASAEQLKSLVHPDDRELVWSRHRDRLAGKETPDRYEFRWKRKDGSICWVEIHANKIKYQGRPAIQAAYVDITERKKAEEALRQSEERLKVLFESAPDAIYLNDLKGDFVDGNKATERMLGYTKAELKGKNFIEAKLLSPGQARKATVNSKMIAKGQPTGPDEFTLTRKDGSCVDVEIRTFPVNIGDRMLSLGVARDISARKITERKLIEHQAQLKSLASELSLTEERERHRLATELHDQIGQVLIFSRIKLQELHASLSSEEVARPLDEVCKNLDRIIQDTRTLTFDLSSPILYELGFEAAVAEWLEEQIEKKHGIKTEFKDDGRPKPLDDDIRVLLFRNVRELLINVVKHANAQKVKVSIRRDNEQINVSVEDDGVGFNPAETTSSAGFGIFSIRERLEQLAGHIHIESEPGRGSKITMTAPVKYDKKLK